MSVFHENMLIGSSGQGAPAAAGISRSLRFNSSDSAYLSRTFGSGGNRRKWTWAAWVKRSQLGVEQALFGRQTSGSDIGFIAFTSGNALEINNKINNNQGLSGATSALFRDTAAWYHIVVAFDNDNLTNADRCKIYVNGTQQSFASITYLSSGDAMINEAQTHAFGRREGLSDWYLSAYLADAYFIDGQALTPSSFTETDATTGQLIPKAYTGSYGTNGFHLEFSDNSGTTSTTLGKDSAGSNNFTPNNFSVASGSGNDSLVDVPTNGAQTDTGVGGEVRGNYCTLNPLAYGGDINAPTNGNLDVTSGTSSDGSILGTFGMSSGKWYFEVTCNNTSTAGIGIAKSGVALANYPGEQSEAWVVQCQTPFYKVNNNVPTALTGTFSSGDIIGVAFDADNGNLSFYQNGSVIGSNAFTGLTNGPYLPIVGDSNSTPSISLNCNFGQRQFAYTSPTGFKALCTANLPAPLVTKPSTVMDVKLYTGNGTGQSITGLGFSPDLIWYKRRNTSDSHIVEDVIRGASQRLNSDTTNAEYDMAAAGFPTTVTFDANGFTVGTNGSVNANGSTYVAWTWDAGSSTVTNTAGSITSSVRANATAGFSVVTYVGTGGTGGTVGHGLGVAPSLIIAKSRSASRDWAVYHKDLTKDKYLNLNTTTGASTTTGVWGAAEPTSSVFGVYAWSTAQNNASGENIVAYCFAPVVGYSSMGNYVGNGSSDGPFVFTGMRPRWILVKANLAGAPWAIFDSQRNTYNFADLYLQPNSSAAEVTGSANDRWDLLSNGFKLRGSGLYFNNSGTSYVYAAFAESPFNYARAR